MEKEKNNPEIIGDAQQSLTGEDAQQPLTVEDTQTPPEQETGTKKKEKKPSRSKHRKELRKELRRQKKEAWRSKTLLGKLFHGLYGLVKFVVIIAMLITIVRVNYKEAGAGLSFASALVKHMNKTAEEVTQEQIYEMAPLDEERGAAIDATAPIGEGETWAIYAYIVGSNLESENVNQLSDTVSLLVESEGMSLKAERNAKDLAALYAMVDTILANDLNLPDVMYDKSVDTSNLMQTSSQEIQTYLMNMFGESYAASEDIDEMLAVTLPENVQMVIQPGGATAWGNSMINPNKTQRFLYDSKGMRQVYDGHVSNMGDPNTLVDFLRYCEEEYPADHTMVIFWNHGAGAFGFGVDSVYMGDLLSLKDIRWAFEQVYTPNENNPPVDIIGFDACLMASMEVANTFHGFGSYLLGSEEVEPGSGWDYSAWLGALAENPRMNAQQLCKAVTDSYVDFYSEKAVAGGGGGQLFATIDLSYADELYRAYSEFANAALIESVSYAGTAAELGRAANSSIKFAVSSMDVYNTVDLGIFMQNIHGSLEPYSQKVLDVLDDMVIYNRALKSVADSTGITVHYPAAVNSLYGILYAADYIDNICDDPNIRALYYYKVAGCLPEELQQYVSELGYGELRPMNVKPLHEMEKAEFRLLEDGNFAMPFAEEARSITQEYRYNLMQVQEDGSMLHLGYDSYLTVNEAGELVSVYDGKWAMIDGQLLPTKVVNSGSDTLRYCAPVKYNSKDANLLLSYDRQTGETTILGVQLAEDTSSYDVLADRQTEELKPGDVIAPIYESYELDTGIGKGVVGQSIIYKEDMKVENEFIPNGSYMCYVSLVDARGDLYDMKLVSFDINRGNISNAQLVESY